MDSLRATFSLSLLALGPVLLVPVSRPGTAESATFAASTPPANTLSDASLDASSADRSARIRAHAAATVGEARARARLLHETLHGALQVMHRDFFRADDSRHIPSRSLEDVFSELADGYGVRLRWIAVDLHAMNVDNEPQTDFERAAVRALSDGDAEFESVADNEFRYVGAIRLSATCLSCHASRRSNNDARTAGLVITLPLRDSD